MSVHDAQRIAPRTMPIQCRKHGHSIPIPTYHDKRRRTHYTASCGYCYAMIPRRRNSCKMPVCVLRGLARDFPPFVSWWYHLTFSRLSRVYGLASPVFSCAMLSSLDCNRILRRNQPAEVVPEQLGAVRSSQIGADTPAENRARKICRSSSMHSGRPLSALFGFSNFGSGFLRRSVSRVSDRAFLRLAGAAFCGLQLG